MKKYSSLIVTILFLVFSIIGFIFSLEFQSMAYWGREGALTMKWYWVGANVSYISSVIALLVMFLKLKGLSKLDIVLRYLSFTVVTITFFLTTLIIIAWKSGF
jgi:hypothetical protein